MIDFLILNYIQQNMPTVNQVGFLSGLKTYGTYNIRIEYQKEAKREYNQVKDEVQALLRDLQAESNFEFDQAGITYLTDLNHEKHIKVKEYLQKVSAQGKLNIEIKQVHEIGEAEKKILLRRFQRGSNYR